jgi:hypothetical protein
VLSDSGSVAGRASGIRGCFTLAASSFQLTSDRSKPFFAFRFLLTPRLGAIGLPLGRRLPLRFLLTRRFLLRRFFAVAPPVGRGLSGCFLTSGFARSLLSLRTPAGAATCRAASNRSTSRVGLGAGRLLLVR